MRSRSLPPPLPPAERTVGQTIAETIRLYGDRFWPSIALGLGAGPSVRALIRPLLPVLLRLSYIGMSVPAR